MTYRNEAHRAAVENRDMRLNAFEHFRGDYNGGFRASSKKLHAAQVALTRAENEITRIVHEDIQRKKDGRSCYSPDQRPR